MTFGEVAYEAYYGFSWDWDSLLLEEQERWDRVGLAVAEEVGKQLIRSLIV